MTLPVDQFIQMNMRVRRRAFADDDYGAPHTPRRRNDDGEYLEILRNIEEATDGDPPPE